VKHVLTPKNTWRAHEDAESGLLVDGRDYYAAFYSAACQAKRSILLLGWQFDSDVELVRGGDIPHGASREDRELLTFLDRLCRMRPELETRVLAWDYSVWFALEREMLQKIVFDVATCSRFHFHWDATAPWPGSHHQKVAIIDGRLAFFGSQDICQERWDDSAHLPDNPLRTCRGEPYKPYHEVQLAVTGTVARSLLDLFVERWRRATGEQLDPNALIAPHDPPAPLVTLPMPRARLALARTMAGEEAQEIKDQYVRAIRTAKRFIYCETQYVTSCAIRDALVERMRDPKRPKLDIVFVLPFKPEGFKEGVTVGLPQADTLAELARCAEETGHRLGVYNVAGRRADGTEAHVYIHSKLMIVDDTFMTIGSANLMNRSMTLDSELNASWEARDGERDLERGIQRARVRLMLEHLGEAADVRLVAKPEGMVQRLDRVVAEGRGRLRQHPVDLEQPSPIARVMQEGLAQLLDPKDATETCDPVPESSAA
jgi:phosphatidylserine/phosphatidylglycerophosphate/cardiolipin synthase-like enzyme